MPVVLLIDEIVPLATIIDSNYIDELVEDHSHELTANELMELHSVSKK